VGNPIIGVNLVNQEGQLGCPNPSANPIGVHQAYDKLLAGYALLLLNKML